MKPNVLASAIIIITPAIALLISFAVMGCTWGYYLVGWFTGIAIGLLALLTIIKLTK